MQNFKSAIAAVMAWILADSVLALPQPFLAPYTAVFVVEATVYRSVRQSAQQLAAIAGAVLVAAIAGNVLPWTTVSVGLAVLVGLLIGQWHRLGDAGPWVGITALILVTWGTATQTLLLVDRLLESLLGVAVGTAVNALLFPPIYARGVRDALWRLAEEVSGLLHDIAGGLRQPEPSDDAGSWVSRAYRAENLVSQAEQAASWSRESRRLNIRRHASRSKLPDDQYRLPLASLRSMSPYVREVADAVQAVSEDGEVANYPDPRSRERFADLLDSVACAVWLRADTNASAADFDEALSDSRKLLDELDDRVTSTPPEAVGPAVGLAGMLIPTRRILRELATR